MRILVAEDDPQVAEGLRQLLGYLGHEVSVAQEPNSVIEQLQALVPDILLLDWLMPDGGGQRVIGALARNAAAPTRVVLMTGSAREALPASVSDLPILYKPFRLHNLIAALNSLQPAVSVLPDQ